MQTPAPDSPILFFDGVCDLCNRWVQFIIRHDKKKRFLFASLQSAPGQKLLAETRTGNANNLQTVILCYKGRHYTKSAAVLKIGSLLGGFWALSGIGYIIPPFLRNALYDYIARNRYKWFGRRDSCMVPTPEQKARFIE